jgi:hypothetical protein
MLPNNNKWILAPLGCDATSNGSQLPTLSKHPSPVYLNINQLDALNFIMSLFHASTCFEHMCSSLGGQNFTIRPLVSSHSVGGRPVHRLRKKSSLNLCTVRCSA